MQNALHGVMTQPFAILILCALCLGCSEGNQKVKGPPPESAYTIERERLTQFDDDGEQLKRAETFRYFETVASSILRAGTFNIYEGLPSWSWEEKLFEQELSRAKTIAIARWPFYEEPVKVSDETAAKLLSLASSRNSFIPFQGFKSCGGFHPDWCMVWKDAEKSYAAMFCFSCGELMVFADDERILYCDMWDHKQFEQVLTALRTNRPQ